MNNNKNKNLLIGGLIALVFMMIVGYGAFSTQLNINGTANINSRWDVHIKSITAGTPTGTASNISATVDESKLTATFQAEVQSPGDELTYTVEVENSGTLPAKLDKIDFNEEENNAIVHSYSGIQTGSVIQPDGGTTTFTVTVKYNPEITSQPEDVNESLTMTLSYVQGEGE